MLEVISQSSPDTSPNITPEKQQKEMAPKLSEVAPGEVDAVGKTEKEFEDNFGFLVFDDQQLANSIEESASGMGANTAAGNIGTAPLSTRSETEEE